MPGIFEMVLISETPENLSDWHRKFIELFEALYQTGYSAAFNRHPTRIIRYLPVGRIADAHPMALPSDHKETVLDRYKVFGIGHCQCRTTMAALGHGCGKPLDNCTVMGEWAEQGIRDGWLKQADKRDVLEAKREAESHGMANFVMNVESARGQASCSCCGCCCKGMRTMTEFSAPSLVAPPHFLPKFDPARCTYCGKCAVACPMGALTIHMSDKSRQHSAERCIGCGVCAVACPQPGATTMEPVADYHPPYRNWPSLFAHNAPAMLKNAWHAWRNRP
jgi:Pyruvate/2-oxoacid:ferredoxin oxidoreductase delta subunit